MSTAGICDGHPGALASYRCQGCGKWLCYDCIEEEDSRFLAAEPRCRHCGERAITAEEALAAAAVAAPDTVHESPALGETPAMGEPPAAVPVPDILYRSRPESSDGFEVTSGPSARDRDATPPFLLFAHHAVVPAATIAMVTSLLYFLLALRSVYFGDSGTLHWLGFWFVSATVLIARYGKMTTYDTEEGRQGCYTLVMAFAMVCVLLVSPWENADAWGGRVVNSLIFLAVWHFATRLTAGLSLEGEEWWPRKDRLYGLERIAVEELDRQRQDRSAILRLDDHRRKPRRRVPADSGGGTDAKRRGASPKTQNPSAAVAHLALMALLLFAVSEPLLLAASPQAGESAAASMIVFLFATGVVLSAASSVAAYRRVRAAGGRASLAVIPGRLAAGAGLMAVILAVAVSLPAIEIRGRGEIKPESTGPVSEDPSRTESRTDDAAETRREQRGLNSPASSLLDFLSQLGKWLRIPFALAVAVLAGLGIWRLWPLLASWGKNLRSSFQSWWQRLAQQLSRWLGGRRRPTAALADPLGRLDSLQALPPREAVLGAYGLLLTYFDQAGHPRPERQTPHEFLSHARRRFREVARPVARLTEAYVEAAYSEEEVSPVRRREAIAAITELVSKGPLKPRGPDAPYPSGREDGKAS